MFKIEDAWICYEFHLNDELFYIGACPASKFHRLADANLNSLFVANVKKASSSHRIVLCGVFAKQGNSIFCSNTIDQAFRYGGNARRHFYIFPKNGFHYTWYADTDDLYQLNFNLTLTDKNLSIDDLMAKAQPQFSGLEKALGTYRHHEIHFTGGYWAIDRAAMGQMVAGELTGQGFAQRARYGRLSQEMRKALGFKVNKK